MDSLTKIKEILSLLSFAFGMFKSTPEGRARREAIRKAKDREKYEKDLLKMVKKETITYDQYRQRMQDYDNRPQPLLMDSPPEQDGWEDDPEPWFSFTTVALIGAVGGLILIALMEHFEII